MVKAHLIAGMVAIMSLGGIAATENVAPKGSTGPKDTRIIVEVDKDIESSDQGQIEVSQKNILRRIAKKVTTNFDHVDSFSRLNNAVVLDVNKEDIEGIKALQGVKSVTIDKPHAYKSISSGDTYVASRKSSRSLGSTNISAETMHKPSDTKEGAGTVIAILDNEFFFRGKHTETEDCSFHKFDLDGEGAHCDGSAIGHEVYSALDSSVPVRYTYKNLASIISNETHAKRSVNVQGREGSLYYNNKVPFYYDYGGESTSYGKAGPMDYDVSSIVAYHGSHVASIASANAPTYKGIAPNAQLACMKVFTNYVADDTAKNLGFSDSSGAYDSCILAALEDCIALDVDGINMSLGSDLDDFDSDSITLKTLTKLANESGIMSAISAGNSGKTSYSFTGSYGNWTTDMVETGIMSSYANNAATTTIASGQPTEIFYKNAIKLGTKNIAYEDQITNREGYEAEYPEEFFLSDLPQPVSFQYIPGFGQAADYNAFSAEDLEGKVLIVNRGSTSFADKYNLAVTKGAIGLIIINNDPTSSDFNFRCSFGDNFNASIPCALVLYKDKLPLLTADHGTFTFIKDEESDNPEKYTMSTFSTDGATYDYDLKPEITAPGDNIRGAVPPQTKEHKATPLSSYEYLSGTSMSAPNYAGAQSLLLSKVAYDDVSSVSRSASVKAFRKTVDMRLASTADPMYETDVNPETEKLNFASPRLQGAGMVDLDGAYHTEVYLEGKDEQGNPLNKSKIVLRNSADIAKGDIKLSFLAHNEGSSDKHYTVKLTVMRPAVKNSNLIATREYNYKTEISEVKYLPGISYYDQYAEKQMQSYGETSYKDVYKLSRDIEYYASEAAYKADEKTIIPAGMVYVASAGIDQTSNVDYQPLPGYDFQSTQDVVIAEVSGQVVTAAANSTSTITINPYSLDQAAKDKIAKYYPYGCALEGYVTLKAQESDTPDLNIPYLGFYSGDGSYEDAPVVEPFDFEKDSKTIYPSDLVNDLAKSLVGKDNVNMGSSWAIGYAKNPETIDRNKALSNDLSIYQLKGFREIGRDPRTGEYNSDVKNHLYVGNPAESNTMLIQQYVMRSVNDNYFTITSKSTGKVVYKSVLEDSLYGDQYGRYPLYKSHVDSGFLSAGYIGHRAEAAVPLYDPKTNVPFADGEYEITFNYQLVGCGNKWVSKSYVIHIDSKAPEFDCVSEYESGGKTMVRFSFKDVAISYGVIGYQIVNNVGYDSSSDTYYMDMEKSEVLSIIDDIGVSSTRLNRIYVQLTDKAYGTTGVVIHFFDLDCLELYNAVSHKDLKVNNDFIRKGDSLSFISIDDRGRETALELDSDVDRYDFHVTGAADAVKASRTVIENVYPYLIIMVVGTGLFFGVIGVRKYLLKRRIK